MIPEGRRRYIPGGMKHKPLQIDWDELETAFENRNEDLTYYLDLVTGQVILEYVVLYAAQRFVIEFFRDDDRGTIDELIAAVNAALTGCPAPS